MGAPAVTDAVPFGGVDRASLLALAAAAEANSEHPLARAVVDAAGAERSSGPGRDRVRVARRAGAWPRPSTGGRCSSGTGPSSRSGASPSPTVPRPPSGGLEEAGRTAVLVASGGEAVGILAVADPVKPTTARPSRP